MSTSSTQELAGQVAVVTGASRGIGKAIALRLAELGADVLIHGGHDLRAAEMVAREITEMGRQAIAVTADISDPMACQRLVAESWQWRNHIDIWINNAGADVLTGEAAGWDFDRKLARLWQVDVCGTIALSREVGGRMRAAGGSLLNMGWDQAEVGMAGDSGEMFAAIKGAIMAFTRSLAKSLAPQVRVNGLAPGWIQTAWGETASTYWQSRAQAESLLKRWGTPTDVADAAAFIVSPRAKFITGQIININGGFAGHAVDPDTDRSPGGES